MGHTQKCITGTQTCPINKLGGWKHTINRPRRSDTKYCGYWWYVTGGGDVTDYGGGQTSSGNWHLSVIGNRGGWWTFRNWGDIYLSTTSVETTQTKKQWKQYSETGGQTSCSSPRKWRKISVGAAIMCYRWRVRLSFPLLLPGLATQQECLGPSYLLGQQLELL